MSYLKLIRFQNLFFIAFVQILIRYELFIPLGATLSLSDFLFTILVLSTLFIAAAGYIINNIYDVETDTINKPNKIIVGKSISDKTAYTLFIIFTIIGVGLGYYLSLQIEKPEFFGFFVVISALLYLYSSFLKSIAIVGNVIISLLIASSLLLVGLFDLFPAIDSINQAHQSFVFRILLNYAFFAFYISLMREIIKDIEDVDGDINTKMNTLPILIGRKRAAHIVFSLGILLLFILVYYIFLHLYNHTIAVAYFLLLIIAPLGYFCIKLWDAKSKNDYSFLSKLLKIIMILGVGSMLLYPFVLI